MMREGLNEEQMRRFEDLGYLLVEGLLTPADLAPVIAEFEAVIDRSAKELYEAGRIDGTFADHGFETRLAKISEQSSAAFRALFSGVHTGPALFGLLRNERILAIAEGIIGPEIMCHPAYRVRPKLPDLERLRALTVVPWHQDASYAGPECDATLIVTFWIPLTESTLENGCLEVIPRSQKLGLLRHRNIRGNTYLDIPSDALPDAAPVAVPASPGDVLLMTNLTVHRSTPNRTQRTRWSVDVRYHRPDQPSGFPLEAGFLARSRLRPQDVVKNVVDFQRLRSLHRPGAAPRWQRWAIEEPG